MQRRADHDHRMVSESAECGSELRGQVMHGCLSCVEVEAKPFVVPEHEQRLGVITLPLGISVEGLDSMEARRLFLSARRAGGAP